MKTHSFFHSLCTHPGLAGAVAGAAWLCACCTPAHVVSSAGDTATSAVKGLGKTAAFATRTATKTAVSAVGAAGKVVHSGVSAASEVTKATVSAAAGVVTAPFVILKDTKSGKSCCVPWREGMTMAAALQEAKVTTELAAVKILRDEDGFGPNKFFVLKPGDVIELTAKGGVPALVAAGAL